MNSNDSTNGTSTTSTAQVFKHTKPEYRLNKATDELVKLGTEVDINALINSAVETALDKALQRLLPEQYQASITEGTYDPSKLINDLDSMTDYLNYCNQLCEEYGLEIGTSPNEIAAYIESLQTTKEKKNESTQN